jgi:hypothetical protein
MPGRNRIQAVKRTEFCSQSGELTVTVAGPAGSLETLTFSREAAGVLALAMADFTVSAIKGAEHAPATKMPERYSVGHGRFERLVLVRFEDEAPYALEPAQAAELGAALLQEAQTAAAKAYAGVQ